MIAACAHTSHYLLEGETTGAVTNMGTPNTDGAALKNLSIKDLHEDLHSSGESQLQQ